MKKEHLFSINSGALLEFTFKLVLLLFVFLSCSANNASNKTDYYTTQTEVINEIGQDSHNINDFTEYDTQFDTKKEFKDIDIITADVTHDLTTIEDHEFANVDQNNDDKDVEEDIEVSDILEQTEETEETVCNTDSDCNDNEYCTTDHCINKECVFEPIEGCCQVDADCNDFNVWTSDKCNNNKCTYDNLLPVSCYKPLVSYSFNTDEIPSSVKLNIPTGSSVLWHIDKLNPIHGAGMLCFNNPATETYENMNASGQQSVSTGTILFPPIQLSGASNYYLSFYLLLDTEWTGNNSNWSPPDNGFDFISIKINDKEVWNSLGFDAQGTTCSGMGCKVIPVFINLNQFKNQTIQPSITFDSVDNLDNAHRGACLDDLSVMTLCTQFECLGATECDDKNDFCTKDFCTDWQCTYEKTGLYGCCSPDIETEEDFEQENLQVKFTNSNSDSVKWQLLDTDSGAKVKSGSHSLYFGNKNLKNYNDPELAFVSGAFQIDFTVPENGIYHLQFWTWIDVDDFEPDKPFLDLFQVSMNTDETFETLLFSNKQKPELYAYYKKWYHADIAINNMNGKNISIIFEFNSGNSSNNFGQGIFIDDIALVEVCP